MDGIGWSSLGNRTPRRSLLSGIPFTKTESIDGSSEPSMWYSWSISGAVLVSEDDGGSRNDDDDDEQ